MDNKEYESRVTQLFCEVMDVVRARRKARFYHEQLLAHTTRMNVDSRIIFILMNEYERSLEQKDYKMLTVPEIREKLRESDEKNNVADKRLEMEWAMEQGGGH
jgi:hypothetical protein